MVVEEFFSRFKVNAETSKLKDFVSQTMKSSAASKKANEAWANFQARLKMGTNVGWFKGLSGSLTAFNRTRVFANGIKNSFQILDKLTPGRMFSKLSESISGTMVIVNRFGIAMGKMRSAMRSWLTVFSADHGSIFMAMKAKLGALWLSMKAGFAKVWPVIKGGALAAWAWMKKGWGNLTATILSGNNKFLKSLILGVRGAGGKLGPALSKLGSGIQGSLSGIPKIGGLLGSLPAVAVGAAAALGAVVAAIFLIGKGIKALKAATREFIAFEEGMKGVKRVTLGTAKEMRQLEAAALDAGEASVFTVKEAADAEKFLAMAGLTVNEVMGALPGTLQLAAAGEMDLATAADLATNIMSSNQLQVEDLSRVNDVMAYTAANANTSIVELGGAIANIGPAGRMAGLGVEQLSSWVAILANNGIKGEEAGTMIRNAIMDLTNPTNAMSTALKKGGLDVNNFVDATGKIKNLNAFLIAMQDMDAVSRKGFLDSLDQRTWKALAPVITGSAAAVGEFTNELLKAKGTAASMSKIAFQGLSGSLLQFKSKMGSSMVKFMKKSSLGSLFEDIVRIGSDILPPIIEALGVILGPIITAIRLIIIPLRIAFALLGGILKLVVFIVGGIVSKLLVPFQFLINIFTWLIDKMREFFGWLTSIETGPIGAIIRMISFIIDKVTGFFEKFKGTKGMDIHTNESPGLGKLGMNSGNNSNTTISVDSPINISGVDTNNADAVGAAARSAVAIEVRKIIVEAGF